MHRYSKLFLLHHTPLLGLALDGVALALEVVPPARRAHDRAPLVRLNLLLGRRVPATRVMGGGARSEQVATVRVEFRGKHLALCIVRWRPIVTGEEPGDWLGGRAA